MQTLSPQISVISVYPVKGFFLPFSSSACFATSAAVNALFLPYTATPACVVGIRRQRYNKEINTTIEKDAGAADVNFA